MISLSPHVSQPSTKKAPASGRADLEQLRRAAMAFFGDGRLGPVFLMFTGLNLSCHLLVKLVIPYLRNGVCCLR